MMIESLKVSDVQYADSPITNTLGFVCRCGCDLFRIEVSTYLNGDWSQEMICVGCNAINAVTEPIIGGVH